MSPKFCVQCGNELSPGDRFCSGCGATVAEPPARPGDVPASRTPRWRWVALWVIFGFTGLIICTSVFAVIAGDSEPEPGAARPTFVPSPTYTPQPTYTPLPTPVAAATPTPDVEAEVQAYCFYMALTFVAGEDALDRMTAHSFEGAENPFRATDPDFLAEADDIGAALQQFAADIRAMEVPTQNRAMQATALELADAMDYVGANYGDAVRRGPSGDIDLLLETGATMTKAAGLVEAFMPQFEALCN